MAKGVDFNFDGPESGPSDNQENAGVEPGNSGASAANPGNANVDSGPTAIPPATKSRRGRPSLPRDAAGNIIRDSSAIDATGTGTGAAPNAKARKQKGVAVNEYKANDRDQIFANIHGIHAAAAMLTKQPILLLQPEEALGLTKALCDVLDAHQINITDKGGRAGLYVSLALTAYGIYAPRLKAIKQGGGPINITPPRPTSTSEAANAVGGGLKMDFTADVVGGGTMQ